MQTNPQAQAAQAQSHNGEIEQLQRTDGPWFWLSKEALWMILEASKNEPRNSALKVYLALAWLWNDHREKPFQKRVGTIARRAGVSYPTALSALKWLESQKFIAIERRRLNGSKERLPNGYTLVKPFNNPLVKPFQRSLKNLVSTKRNKGAAVRSTTISPSAFYPEEEDLLVRAGVTFVWNRPFPKSEKKMYATLEKLGIEIAPDYDGNFYKQMVNNDWVIPGTGERVCDWVATYVARLEHNTSGGYPY